jgi:hypothetical protein
MVALSTEANRPTGLVTKIEPHYSQVNQAQAGPGGQR